MITYVSQMNFAILGVVITGLCSGKIFDFEILENGEFLHMSTTHWHHETSRIERHFESLCAFRLYGTFVRRHLILLAPGQVRPDRPSF